MYIDLLRLVQTSLHCICTLCSYLHSVSATYVTCSLTQRHSVDYWHPGGGLQSCRPQKSWDAWCLFFTPIFAVIIPNFAAPSWLPPGAVHPLCPSLATPLGWLPRHWDLLQSWCSVIAHIEYVTAFTFTFKWHYSIVDSTRGWLLASTDTWHIHGDCMCRWAVRLCQQISCCWKSSTHCGTDGQLQTSTGVWTWTAGKTHNVNDTWVYQ